VPLRLVHVTGMPRPPFAPAGALAPELEYGETSLRAASHRETGGLSYDLLESRVAIWRERYPNLHIRAVSTDGNLPEFLAGYPQ
jgi:hypothetical protein